MASAHRLLTIVAEHLKADGIELTTAIDNESGFHTYLSAGYEYVGDIANPLEADVTAVLGEQASATRWRVERQMIRVINQSQRAGPCLSGGETSVVQRTRGQVWPCSPAECQRLCDPLPWTATNVNHTFIDPELNMATTLIT